MADDGADELLASVLWDLGTTGVFQDDHGVTVAGFAQRADASAAATSLRGDRRFHLTVAEPVPAPTVEELTAASEPQPVSVTIHGKPSELLIHAGGAFGHGRHPTTALALDLLLELIRPGQRVLDVGTGTGIVAIVAAAGGATVVGMDNDPHAVSVAQDNLGHNDHLVTGDISVGEWTVPQAVEVLGGPADLIVSNVLVPTHRLLATTTVDALAPNGLLVTTGYLETQTTEVVDLYCPPAAMVTERQAGFGQAEETGAGADRWVGHVFRR